MLELVFLAFAGVFAGAALSAARHRAPRALTGLWWSLAVAGLLLAATSFTGPS